MIHHERTLDIGAAPDAVWAVIGRFMHIDEFAPMVRSVDALTDGEDGKGSKRRVNFHNGTSRRAIRKFDSFIEQSGRLCCRKPFAFAAGARPSDAGRGRAGRASR